MLIDILAAGITFLVAALLAWPLGLYMARVYQGQPTFLTPVLRPVERQLYRLTGIRETDDQPWHRYALSALAVTVTATLITYLLLRVQGRLPLNVQGFGAPAADLSLNTAISFATNTSWQNYPGEQTMTYLSQLLPIGMQMFLSAGAGMAFGVALIRGFTRQEASGIGNFAVDLTRSILYVLLPISVIGALILAGLGVVQNFQPYTAVRTLQGAAQVLAQGPVASFEVIKDMSGDGGGFFNANSGHPFENPSGLTNQIEILLMILVPFALPIAMGRMVGRMRQGLVVFIAMWVLLVGGTAVAAVAEQSGNPALAAVGVTQARTTQSEGGNMEGKSVRSGPILSAEFAAASTGSGDGAVDSSHDSFTPIGGMIPLILMKLGELSPGGPGAGLYGILVVAIQAVFVAGLMIGRTPEYLGKKIGAPEMRLVVLAAVSTPILILVLSALSLSLAGPLASIANPGPHGMTEVLYAFASGAVNNGSAFAGLSGNTLYYNVMLGVDMWVGRFAVVIPVLALAGALAAKRRVAPGAGTLPTDTPVFAALLVGFVILLGALMFLPALALAPVLEQLRLVAGHLAH